MSEHARLTVRKQQGRDAPAATSAVATNVGFADAGSFRRAFGQWFGMAPAAWRERALAHRGECQGGNKD